MIGKDMLAKRSIFQLVVWNIIMLITIPMMSQEDSWFYIRAKDSLFHPEFKVEADRMVYHGSDETLKEIFDKYEIKEFKKTYRNAKKEYLKMTFFVIADKKELCYELLKCASDRFTFGEIINDEDRKIFEPNDYGLTSTIGENTGAQAYLDYLDFLELPKAWYYTTGSPSTIIGISDARVDTSNIEFKHSTVDSING